MKDSFIIFSQIKVMCNGLRNFILITFHLVSSNGYIRSFSHMIVGFIDILNGENTSDDSTESSVRDQ